MSAIGTVLSGVGVAVYVFVETGDAAWLGALAALAAAPYVLTAPLVKHADRFPRRTVMIAADAFAAIGPAIALGLVLAHRLEIWHLVVAGFLGGVGNAFQWPAAQAAVPALVEPGALDRANGLNQLGPAMGIVLGPVLATPLVAWFGIEAVLMVDLATFAIAVATTALVRFGDHVDVEPVDDDGSWNTVWTWLRSHGRPLIGLLVVMAVVNFLLSFFNVALLVVATDLGGTARAGLALGAGGIAMIVGSVAVGRRGVAPDRIGTFAHALVVAGTGCAIAAVRPHFALVVTGVFIALVAVPAVNAAVATVYQERVPASMQGRVFGLRSAIGRALEPIGSVAAGVAVAHLAIPALRADGVLAGSVGEVIGVGPQRGAALVLLAIGLGLAVAGGWLARSWIRTALRESATNARSAATSDTARPGAETPTVSAP